MSTTKTLSLNSEMNRIKITQLNDITDTRVMYTDEGLIDDKGYVQVYFVFL